MIIRFNEASESLSFKEANTKEAMAKEAMTKDAMTLMTDLLLASSLPRVEDVPKLDLPFFYKYYYEFALMRGVLAEELQKYWSSEAIALCRETGDGKNRDTTGEMTAQCMDARLRSDVFLCQEKGFDYDFAESQCLNAGS